MAHADVFPDLLVELRRQDDVLQAAMKDFMKRYYLFLHSSRDGTKQLRLRFQRDRDGRIRRIAWTRRVPPARLRTGTSRPLDLQLPGPFQTAWVYQIACHWNAVDRYLEFEQERKRLCGFRSRVVDQRRRIVLSLRNGWLPKAQPDEWERAKDTQAVQCGAVGPRELTAVVGALAWARALTELEAALDRLVHDYWSAFDKRDDIPIEPHLTRRDNGMLRLRWCWRGPLHSYSDGRTEYGFVAGMPTERWMRSIRMAPVARKDLHRFLATLRPVQAAHQKALGYIASFRKVVFGLRGEINRALHPVNPQIDTIAGEVCQKARLGP